MNSNSVLSTPDLDSEPIPRNRIESPFYDHIVDSDAFDEMPIDDPMAALNITENSAVISLDHLEQTHRGPSSPHPCTPIGSDDDQGLMAHEDLGPTHQHPAFHDTTNSESSQPATSHSEDLLKGIITAPRLIRSSEFAHPQNVNNSSRSYNYSSQYTISGNAFFRSPITISELAKLVEAGNIDPLDTIIDCYGRLELAIDIPSLRHCFLAKKRAQIARESRSARLRRSSLLLFSFLVSCSAALWFYISGSYTTMI